MRVRRRRPGKRPLRIALVGFGSVGRCFAERLRGPYLRALRHAGAEPRVTGIATARHGIAIDSSGISLARALQRVSRASSLESLCRGKPPRSVAEMIDRVRADVLVELTPLEPLTGQPALDHVRRALRRGMDVVTANKGPIAHALPTLRRIAERNGARLLHESTVMDGAPVFNLKDLSLRGTPVTGFRGVLNSTTTHVLSRMEQGATRDEAIAEAQALGIVEADPRYDIDGWDAAVKGSVLSNAILERYIRPTEVRRRGVGNVTQADVLRAREKGRRIRLVTRGVVAGRGVRVSVAPEELALDDPLAVAGADAVLVLETELLGEIGILKGGGGVDQTAFGVLSDLLRLVEEPR